MNSILADIFDPDRFSEVWASITRNRRRSLLTAFGVFWGVFMLVVMLSMGKGLKGSILNGIDLIPSNMTLCFTNRTTIPYAGFRKGRVWDINTDDILELKTQIPQLQTISPVVWGGSPNIVNSDKSGSYQLRGISGDYTKTYPIKIVAGRFINDMDVLECRKVVVLGQKIVDDIFFGEAPLGQYVKIGGISYQVRGVAVQTTDSFNMGGREDEIMNLPYTLVQRIYNMGSNVGMIMIRANGDVAIKSMEEQIGAILKSRHQISPDDDSALQFMNLDQIVKVFTALGAGISLLMWIVGLGTLLSGAVGVSNIVMITVKERTNEIGVRRAIGAKPSSIVAQIMSESLLITVVAGIVGLVTGVVLMAVIGGNLKLGVGDSAITLVDPMLDFSTAVSAFAVIIVIGLAAGLLPASRALKIKAIDAIREE